MQFAMHATKLVVADLERCEAFYIALGMTATGRNIGGEGDVRQAQTWLSADGGAAHTLILTQFVELPPPSPPRYPGEIWLCFQVPDVEATLVAVVAAGGSIYRPGEDIADHGVRAAVARDPEGHIFEIVGPIQGR